MNESQLIFPYPARVLRVDMQTRSADLLALAKQSHAFDPAIFEERQPFFWSAQVSNGKIDAYFTHMLPSTLANFANDARNGVSFLNSHRQNELPFGRSLDGRLIDSGDGQSVVADFFTLSGLNLNGITTDNFIAGVRSGIISDVSVGFYGGALICDVCNRAFFECPHIPGMTYETKGADKVTRQVVATFGIDNARLAEVSGVFDGATPDATIMKAKRMAEAGKLKPEAARALEARYRMKFTNSKSFAGIDLREGKSKTMDFEQMVTQIREVLAVDDKVDVVGAVMTTNTELLKLRTLNEQTAKDLLTAQEQVRTLTPQAEDGKQYRQDLVSEAIAEGVRALGDKFSKETYENLLRSAPLTVVKQMKNDWAAVGDVRFPRGRQTTDDGEQAPGDKRTTERNSYVPLTAFKA